MSNIVLALLALLFVYCIEVMVCFFAFKMLKKFTNVNDINPNGTYIATVRTLHVVALIGVIYFIPLVALAVCLAINSLLIGPIILLILGSSIFVTKKIIIPASESKHVQLYEKYYGKDSYQYKTLIEKNEKK